MKPVFLPLKACYFEAFEQGTKVFEFRPYGPRWNERTCVPGRAITLSYGYGRARRLAGVISSFARLQDPTGIPGWADCYGSKIIPVARIGIACSPFPKPLQSPTEIE